jgi:hypothetical protein
MDLINCSVTALVEAANRHGVHYFLPANPSAHNPTGRLMIWNHRDPARQRIVDAMRERRDEVSAFLRAHRPPPLVVPVAEVIYRRDVLHELDDDLPLAELPASALRAYIIGIVHDTLAAERSTAEWEREHAAVDVPNVASRKPAVRKPRNRPSTEAERVVFG